MRESEISSRLKKMIGENLVEIPSNDLAILLDYEIQKCERQMSGSFIAGTCNNATILTAEAMRRNGENFRRYLKNKGFLETRCGHFVNDKMGFGFDFPCE